MRVNTVIRALLMFASVLILAFAAGCGGGSGSSTRQTTVSSAPSITIATTTLPPAIGGHPYSTTLVAANAQGPVKWSIAPISPTSLFVDGLAIDASTGVLSGTANFGGTAGFTATVTDGVHTASKGMTITAFPALSVGAGKTVNLAEFSGSPVTMDFSGGVPPVSFQLVSGSLPPGMRVDPNNAELFSGADALGTFVATIQATDSFSPPETATQQVTINVTRPLLSIANSLPSRLAVNVAFSGKVVARGGTPPYSFSLRAGQGTLPTGLTLDPSTGQVTGTPSASGTFPFFVSVSDASTPPQGALNSFNISVGAALGRNDSIANATAFPGPVGGNTIFGSISPYIDPPNQAPTTNDTDYYKVTSAAGSTISIQVLARVFNQNSPLDTVLEIVDGNGVRFNTCRDLGSTTTFTSICLNDDTASSTDSAIQFQVPGTAGTPVTFYVHILDFRGDARPDMQYSIIINGVTP